ncbi:MAG TPA: hypothetical protein VM240_05480 [Verrucomicrobiae bacterium]|nr:hypothetical protein [Verrucomicrobiae bacterium]
MTFTLTINARSGSLDVQFSGDGIASHHNAAGGNGHDLGEAITVDSDGKILVTGSSVDAAPAFRMTVWRYNANGTLDTTFAQNGVLIGSSGYGNGNSIKLDASGKIVVAGNTVDTDNFSVMGVWRFNADGSPDATFGTNGRFTYTAGGNANVEAIAFDSSGRILVTGVLSPPGEDADMAILRLLADGTLDPGFDVDGVAVNGGAGLEYAQELVIDSVGRIVVAGATETTPGGSTDLIVWRYNDDGSLDSSFDFDGMVTHNNAAGGDSYDLGDAVTIDADGKILVTGYSYGIGSGNGELAVWRFNADGTLDDTFNSDGIAVHADAAGSAGKFDMGRSVVVDGSGRIVVTGSSHNASNADMAVWRFNPDGSLDTNFDSDGVVIHRNAAGGASEDLGREVALDAAGKVLVVGNSINSSGNYDMTIWRFNP